MRRFALVLACTSCLGYGHNPSHERQRDAHQVSHPSALSRIPARSFSQAAPSNPLRTLAVLLVTCKSAAAFRPAVPACNPTFMGSQLLVSDGRGCRIPLLRMSDVAVEKTLQESLGMSPFYCDSDACYGMTDEWLLDGIAAVREKNAALLPLLEDLRSRRFFRFYAVDLMASCPFMPTSESECDLGECEVEPSGDVPPEISERDVDESDFELDSWARWDQPSDFTEYYDVVENPEGNTGYDGSRIWNFIHSKVSFQKDVDKLGNEWKSDFNRAVSGLHAAVSTSIIADLEQSDPAEALAEYRRRLRDLPAAIANLHFTFMLTLCAIGAARDFLDNSTYLDEGPELLPTMRQLLESDLISEPVVQQAAANLIEHANSPSASAWQLRMRTRDLLNIMNCVQCNQCRLHGKLNALGLAACLQALLGLRGRGEDSDRDPDPSSLRRVEVAALVTWAAKLSAACEVVAHFQQLDAQDTAAN